MRPFRFRLQRVLDVSGRVVKARTADLAAAMAREREAARRLAGAQELRRRRLTDLAARQSQGMAPWEWAVYARYLAGLKAEEARLAGELSRRRTETEARREELLERRREQKALEVLRSRAWKVYQAETEREERKILDDLAAGRYARGDNGSPYHGAAREDHDA